MEFNQVATCFVHVINKNCDITSYGPEFKYNINSQQKRTSLDEISNKTVSPNKLINTNELTRTGHGNCINGVVIGAMWKRLQFNMLITISILQRFSSGLIVIG